LEILPEQWLRGNNNEQQQFLGRVSYKNRNLPNAWMVGYVVLLQTLSLD